MIYGYVTDGTVLTLIQSKNAFFRILAGNGDFHPHVVLLKTDKKGMAHSNPVQFGNDCNAVKRCIDQFASEELGIASSCKDGLFKASFFQN